ncbi:helix-turn-helix domain-containing protein [Fodinicurvata sediminis]|uniref:helix-turn-helix domain-containing protein n=1 Tax=Fodinicurvata sediminis TaxID=1121832 RepID=UPI00047E2340|nr:helix-turn-helix transcriptional regulator [Fodinicurvata sediminis]
MPYTSEDIIHALKEGRAARGLSQRELSARTGVPQSHISKIENGSADIRLSSLIELARALELEVKLVPRKALPAIDSVIRSTRAQTEKAATGTRNLRNQGMQESPSSQPRPAYRLDEDADDPYGPGD